MARIRSSQILAMLVEEEFDSLHLEFSKIFDIVSELHKAHVFCDLSVMDFRDLEASYPEYVKLSQDAVSFKLAEFQLSSFESFDWVNKTKDDKELIINVFRQFIENGDEKKNS